MTVGLDHRAYRRERRALRERCEREGGTCAIPSEGCPGGFDFGLHHNDPWSFTAHHPVARSIGGAVADPANLVPAHRLCNERWGAKLGTEPLEDNHSEDWPD